MTMGYFYGLSQE